MMMTINTKYMQLLRILSQVKVVLGKFGDPTINNKREIEMLAQAPDSVSTQHIANGKRLLS